MPVRTNNSPPQPSLKEMTIALAQLPRALTEAPPNEATPSDFAHAWLVRLMDKEGPGILRMLWRILGSEADVMDAYQDCFCKLAMRKSHADLVSERAYLYRTASNVAIELIRGRRRQAVHLPTLARNAKCAEESAPADTSTRDAIGTPAADMPILREAIASLPAHLRQVIVLRDLSGLSYRDVGRMLGIDPATARVYRRHAVVKLAECMANTPDGEP